MAKFIRLTDASTGGPVFVNVDQITRFFTFAAWTRLCFTGPPNDDQIDVREPLETVEGLINA